MLQAYVVNISSVSDVCCSKCFMLQVFYEQARQGCADEGGPLGRSGPRVRTGSEAGTEQKTISMGVAADVEHKTTSMGEQQARSTR